MNRVREVKETLTRKIKIIYPPLRQRRELTSTGRDGEHKGMDVRYVPQLAETMIGNFSDKWAVDPSHLEQFLS